MSAFFVFSLPHFLTVAAHCYTHTHCYTHCYTTVGSPNSRKASFDLKKAAMGAFTAASLASGIATTPASAIDAKMFPNAQYDQLVVVGVAPTTSKYTSMSITTGSSTNWLAAKVVKEGMYREYEVDLPDEQQYDDAKSTFKSAKETKSKKGTCDV